MTIALAILYFYDHGVARRDLRDLALELKRRGHHVVIFSSRWKSEMLPDVQHIRLAVGGHDTISKLHSFERQVHRRLRESNIDCLVAFSRISGADFYYIGEHSFVEREKEKYGIFRYLLPSFLRKRRLEKAIYSPGKKTRLWALSADQIRNAEESFGTPSERFELLPPGITSATGRLSPEDVAVCREKLREKCGAGENELLCVMSGSDFEEKGVDRVIVALSYLPDADLRKVRLAVSGKGSIAKMDALARHYNVRHRVVFLEKLPAERFLPGADIVLEPGRRALFDDVPLEAIACGVPVVVTSRYSFSGFLSGRGGVVIEEPFHCRTLTRLLTNFIANREKLDALRKKAEVFDPGELYHRIPVMADRIESFRL